MAQSGTDLYGAYVDTGTTTVPTVRANTEVEVHAPGEIDSGSKNTVAQTVTSHGPHRSPNSPR